MKLVLLSLLGALSLLVLSARSAAACTCMISESPCASLQGATVAFVGTVGASREIGKGEYATTIAVEEELIGKLGKTATILHSRGGASCDPYLQPGARLLFYAAGVAPDHLRIGCKRVLAVDRAAEDLKYLRAHKRKSTGVVSGEVLSRSGDPEAVGQPLAGAVVRVRGTKLSTRTAADGSYRLALPPGAYQLEIDAPPDTLVSSWPENGAVRIGNVGACTLLSFSAVSNGRIRGRVTDHRGQPVAGITVSGRRGKRWYEAPTDAKGEYELARLSGGEYVVGVALESDPKSAASLARAPRYFPGVARVEEARPVKVEAGKVTASIDLQLAEPRQLRTVRLRVTQGGAATGKEVHVHETRTRRELWRGAPDAEGVISFPWLTGRIHWDVCVMNEVYRVAHSCVTVRREIAADPSASSSGAAPRPVTLDVDVALPGLPLQP